MKFLFLGLALSATLVTHAATPVDPILTAMQSELDREKAALLLPGMQRPYFIEYRLDDIRSFEAVANYGALTREEEQHQRVIRVTVRVGSYTSDSSSSRGDGTVTLAPADSDQPETAATAIAIRYALWTATDEAYKNALRAYSTKQANLKRFESTRSEQDFAEAKPATAIEPLPAFDLDRAEWKRRIIEASGLFLTQPSAAHIDFSTSNIRAIAVNRFLVNSEGTTLRHGYTGYTANISVGTQAADGMRLSRDNGTTAAIASELESADAFRNRTLTDLKTLEALRTAPVVSSEDYHGPVLFSGDAATDVFNRLFVPNIEADRPELGTTARTTGAYTSSYKSRVLPEILSVTDDPTLKTFAGKTLLGAYTVDDEGIPAEPIDLVLHGKLVNYLVGRTPVRDFAGSNGHGRAAPAQAAHARSGVILVKPTTPVPAAEMQAKLLAMAREQGKDVYMVDTLGGGELAPRMLYLVHAKDGTKELVRGATFDELDSRSLRSDILAAGDDPYVANTLGATPQTTIAPSLLFGDIGVKRATEEQQKLPYYPPPAASK